MKSFSACKLTVLLIAAAWVVNVAKPVIATLSNITATAPGTRVIGNPIKLTMTRIGNALSGAWSVTLAGTPLAESGAPRVHGALGGND